MLATLGYDTKSPDPVFPEPDEEVTAKYKKWLAEQNSDFEAQHVEVDHADFEVPHAIWSLQILMCQKKPKCFTDNL